MVMRSPAEYAGDLFGTYSTSHGYTAAKLRDYRGESSAFDGRSKPLRKLVDLIEINYIDVLTSLP